MPGAHGRNASPCADGNTDVGAGRRGQHRCLQRGAAVLLRPLPYPDADRLVELFEHDRRADGRFFRVSLLNYLSWVERARSFDALATFSGRDFIVTEHGDPERIIGSAVTASLFKVLGVAPIVGRPLTEKTSSPARHLWPCSRSHYGYAGLARSGRRRPLDHLNDARHRLSVSCRPRFARSDARRSRWPPLRKSSSR